MPKRTLLLGLFLICTTLLIFTWMVRDSLCELHFRQEKTELAAVLAYEANVSGIGGESFPASPEWLRLNAPLSMARALRAIAFSP